MIDLSSDDYSESVNMSEANKDHHPGILQWDNRAEKHSQLRENEIAFWKWQD